MSRNTLPFVAHDERSLSTRSDSIPPHAELNADLHSSDTRQIPVGVYAISKSALYSGTHPQTADSALTLRMSADLSGSIFKCSGCYPIRGGVLGDIPIS